MLKINCNQVTINRILKAFLKLSENKDAKNILKNDILKEITDKNFINFLCDSSKNILNNLLIILNENNETNKIKELKKELSVNNNIQNINIVKNITINNNININQQLNMNNGDLLNQKNSNINTNILLVNQINQMKIQQGYMVSPNYTDINFNIYNNNDNYMNNMNYMNNFNSNKGFGNIYYYNYKNS